MKGTHATKAGAKPATIVSPEASARAAVKSAPTKVAANHVGAGPIPAPRSPTVALPQQLKARLAPIVGTRAVETARLHIGPQAQARTRAADARALADGADIYFADGEYRPGTRAGDALIAHEIAHVDQALRGLLHEPARKAQGAAVRNDTESAADAVGERVAAGADVDEQDRKRRESAKVEAGRIGARLALVPDDVAAKPAVPPNAQAATKPGETGAMTPEGAPAREAAGATEEEAGGSPTAGAPKKLDVPLMPAPALTLSRSEKSRATSVQSRAHSVATTTATAPTAKENVDTAKAAVSVPQAESDARAAQKIVKELADAQKPSPEITELCNRIRKLIKEKRANLQPAK